jgi:D-sedoheptulose 7-phosphate isomerase
VVERVIPSSGRHLPLGHDFLTAVRQGVADVRLDDVGAIADVLESARRRRSRAYVFGNGGSAATAAHLACDLAKSSRPGGRLRVVALAESVPTLTACANDLGYDSVFAEQLHGLVDPGDVVLALSVSARSANLAAGLRTARRLGAVTAGLLGPDLGLLDGLLDVVLRVPSDDFGVVETTHLAVVHALSAMLRGRRLTLALDGPQPGRGLAAPEPALPGDG